MKPKELGVLNPAGAGSIDSMRVLTDAEVKAIAEANEGLVQFQFMEQLFSIVALSRDAFSDFTNSSFDQYIQDTSASILGMVPRSTRARKLTLLANMYLLNFLTAMRTYLDHVETRIKRWYGDKSPEVAQFKRAVSKQYDTTDSYAFVWKLRNYSQHCGMPIGGIVLSASIVPGEQMFGTLVDGSGLRALRVYCNRDDLLREFDSWGAKVKSYLAAQDQEIEVTVHVNNAFASLCIIHEEVAAQTRKIAREHAKTLNRFVAEVRATWPDCDPVLMQQSETNPKCYTIHGFMLDEISLLLSGATT
ncbi:hypothetical protein [Sorangium sp. So ce176]|uniref:hypothetical protein n=1 Tax=Sorangium sp. So ce176 TaxID=3133286 RepID=UPI003F622385